MKEKNIFQKIITFSLLLAFIILPFEKVLAQNLNGLPEPDPASLNQPAVSIDKKGNINYTPPSQVGGENSTSGGSTSSEDMILKASGAIGSCTFSSLLGNIVSKTLSNALGEIGGAVTSVLNIDTDSIISSEVVRVQDSMTNIYLAKQTQKDVGARTGQSGNFLSGILSSIDDVSLDAIGFCIVNEMIKYIADSTIEWINSGFEGNPVFVENPEAFFGDYADAEAANFVRQIVGQTAGIDVCQPFKIQLAIEGINAHNRTRGYGRSRLNCSLDQIKNNYEQFVGGDWDAGGLPGWFELIQDENNIYGARYIAEEERRSLIEKSGNNLKIRLDWGKGYKSFTICEPEDKKREDGSCPPEFTKTTTPGGYIEHNINKRADAGQNRLEIADEFDEIVSALIDKLIKIAVNKTFE